jgi:transcription elongation factor GreA
VVKDSPAATLTLVDAATKYLATLSQPASQDAQPAIYRFAQWFGGNRGAAELTGIDVERFVEESTGRGTSQGRNADRVRDFLAYLKKAGITKTNLATAIKIRRTEAASANQDPANAVQMTLEGYQGLQQELAELKTKRPQIAEALRLAMADKDFRENAPLDAARDQQAHVEAQIRRIEDLIKRASIVAASTGAGGVARVGSHVVVRNMKTEQQVRYHLVSPSEVNPKEGKISIASPVGRALVDRGEGEEVAVNVPAGVINLRVETVEN